MENEVYYRLAKVLDTLPNGFPATDCGIEIDLLKKIFTPEQADLFCDLRLQFETAASVAKRTGRPLVGLKEKLKTMGRDGQLIAVKIGHRWYFKMLPWVFGIYEFQLHRMDEELARLSEEYNQVFGSQFFSHKPQLMRVVPIEEEIAVQQEAMSYEKVSSLIDQSQSFAVRDCVCKKERALLGKPCSRPLRVCLTMAPVPDVFSDSDVNQVLTKEEARALLKRTEELALVHLTSNIQGGSVYICNCCGCCCGILRAINEFGIPASEVINSIYYAVIDPYKCVECGICSDERCQVSAIEKVEGTYRVNQERCIGCGLCISTCQTDAINLIRKDPETIETPPVDETEWYEKRGRARRVDFSRHK